MAQLPPHLIRQSLDRAGQDLKAVVQCRLEPRVEDVELQGGVQVVGLGGLKGIEDLRQSLGVLRFQDLPPYGEVELSLGREVQLEFLQAKRGSCSSASSCTC